MGKGKGGVALLPARVRRRTWTCCRRQALAVACVLPSHPTPPQLTPLPPGEEAYLDLVPWQALANSNNSFLLTERRRHYLRYLGALAFFEINGPSGGRAGVGQLATGLLLRLACRALLHKSTAPGRWIGVGLAHLGFVDQGVPTPSPPHPQCTTRTSRPAAAAACPRLRAAIGES